MRYQVVRFLRGYWGYEERSRENSPCSDQGENVSDERFAQKIQLLISSFATNSWEEQITYGYPK